MGRTWEGIARQSQKTADKWRRKYHAKERQLASANKKIEDYEAFAKNIIGVNSEHYWGGTEELRKQIDDCVEELVASLSQASEGDMK